MDDKIKTWLKEVKGYNKRLHLVSASMEKSLEDQARDTMDLLKRVSEPRIADLGSGSGFLGILYKVVNPDSHVFLIERSQKKCIFLRHMIDLLGFDNIDAVEADPLVQTVGPFPAVMSRSFSPREDLLKAVLSTAVPQGRFYFFSTGDQEVLVNPHLSPEGRASKRCGDYRLDLDVYRVTSR